MEESELKLYRIAFTTHLMSFIRQAVTGIIVSSYSFLKNTEFNNKSDKEIFCTIKDKNLYWKILSSI
jgi:hypothetical protein